jgi:predicted RNA-binding Zn-ribbon protein involved in translation (DUF1610 family)
MSERAQPVPGQAKPWRCSHCGHVLAVVNGNECTLHHHAVRLHDKVVAVRCPVCGEYEPWRYDLRAELPERNLQG